MAKRITDDIKSQAVELLAAGKSIPEVCTQLDISRPSVIRHIYKSEKWKAKLDERRSEVLVEWRDQLRAYVPAALNCIPRILAGNNHAAAIKVVQLILKSSGVVTEQQAYTAKQIKLILGDLTDLSDKDPLDDDDDEEPEDKDDSAGASPA